MQESAGPLAAGGAGRALHHQAVRPAAVPDRGAAARRRRHLTRPSAQVRAQQGDHARAARAQGGLARAHGQHWADLPQQAHSCIAGVQVHPLGKSPVITDQGQVIAETGAGRPKSRSSPPPAGGHAQRCHAGAVMEYIVDKYGKGRLKPREGTPDYLRYKCASTRAAGLGTRACLLSACCTRQQAARHRSIRAQSPAAGLDAGSCALRFWMHHAEGSAMPPLLISLLFGKLQTDSPWFIRPVASVIAGWVPAAAAARQLSGVSGHRPGPDGRLFQPWAARHHAADLAHAHLLTCPALRRNAVSWHRQALRAESRHPPHSRAVHAGQSSSPSSTPRRPRSWPSSRRSSGGASGLPARSLPRQT